MNEYIWIYLGVAILMTVLVGIPYISGVRRKNNHYSIKGKREYVVANLERFKVNNEGSSLDDNEIYLVNREKMGFKDVLK